MDVLGYFSETATVVTIWELFISTSGHTTGVSVDQRSNPMMVLSFVVRNDPKKKKIKSKPMK